MHNIDIFLTIRRNYIAVIVT